MIWYSAASKGSVPAMRRPAIAPGIKMIPRVFNRSMVGMSAARMENRPKDSRDCFDVAPRESMVSMVARLSFTSRMSRSRDMEQIAMELPKAIPERGTMNCG